MADQLEQATGRTIADMATVAGERYGDKTAIRQKDGDGWAETSFAAIGELVNDLAAGFIELGLGAGERVAILANTRPEWVHTSFAISTAGGVVVPIYPTNSPKECQWVAGDSEAKIIVVEDADQAAKIAKVRDELPKLEHVVVMEGDADDAITLDALLARVEEVCGQAPIAFPAGPPSVETMGIVTGAGADYVLEAAELGLDAFLTGEPAERSMADSRERGITFIAAGHYATETFGIRRLGEFVQERHDVRVEFLHIPNPI